MPLAMRNLAITQQRDHEHFRHVRGGSYDCPKATFKAGDFVLIKQAKDNALDPLVRPHILRILQIKPSVRNGVVLLEGWCSCKGGMAQP